MDVQIRRMIAAAAAVLAVGYSSQALASQDEVTGQSTYVNDNGQVVHCVATESGRTYCGAAHMHYVIRGTPAPVCVEGKTWGVDDRGVWVTGGCNADFVMSGNEVTGHSTYMSDTGRLVHCVSTANGRTFCGRPHTRYVIHGTPPAACVEGTTWGIDDEHGIWVTRGCAADFDVEPDSD